MTDEISNFDYHQIEEQKAKFVLEQAKIIRGKYRHITEEIFDIGKRLILVKEKLQFGLFQQWLRQEFDWSERTARNFMNVAIHLGEKESQMIELNIPLAALYALASPSMPSPVVQQVLEAVKSGKSVNRDYIKQIKQEYQRSEAQKSEQSSTKQRNKKDKISDSFSNSFSIKESTSSNKPSENTQAKSINLPESQKNSVIDTKPNTGQTKPEIVQIIPKGLTEAIKTNHWWKIDSHLLFLGDWSNSLWQQQNNQFNCMIGFPEKIEDIPPVRFESNLIFQTSYQDVSIDLVVAMVEKYLYLASDWDDNVLIYKLQPHLISANFERADLLEVIEQSQCKAIIFEANPNNFRLYLQNWRSRGKNCQPIVI